MSDLFMDNIEAGRRLILEEGDYGQGNIGQRLSRTEVPDMMSWLQCFSIYAAIICHKYPEKARELWAY